MGLGKYVRPGNTLENIKLRQKAMDAGILSVVTYLMF